MRKKFLNRLIFFLLLMVPFSVNAADYLLCGTEKKIPLVLGQVISIIFVIIRLLVPILLIIVSMISFFKATFSGKVDDELNKAKQAFVHRIIAAVVIFFIVSIVNFVVGLSVGTNNSFSSCLNCMIHPDKCEKIDSDIAKICPGLLSQQEGYDENCVYLGSRKGRIDYSYTGNTGIPQNGKSQGSSNGRSGDFLNWKQCDPKWASVTMGPSKTSLCSAGCTTTSISILMAKSGAVTDMSNFSPVTLAKSLQYSGTGAIKYWDDYNSWKSYAPSFRFVGSYPLNGSISNKANTINGHLNNGEYVMIVVNSGGHYVAADKVEGNTVYIHDPGGAAVDLFKTYASSGVNSILVYKREG